MFIPLRIFDQIQQDNQDAREGKSKSISTILKEKNVSFEQVFYILPFDTVFILFNVYSSNNKSFIVWN